MKEQTVSEKLRMVLDGAAHCLSTKDEYSCRTCPYTNITKCYDQLRNDIRDFLEEVER